MASVGEISVITLPNGDSYDIKDAVARAAIAGGLTFNIATNASNTPEGVQWESGGTVITGTLKASESTTGFYLVPATYTEQKDIYDEYVAVLVSSSPDVYAWEKLGNTEVDFTNLAQYLAASVTQPKDAVLGADTTFTNSSSTVSFSGGSSDSFVKSYPGSTRKLSTTSIKGVGADVTFTSIDENTSVTATNTVFGTATSASKVTTASKTATNLVLGTSTTASKATAGTAVNVAKVASSATNVSYIGNASTSSILESATVNGEELILGSVSVAQSSVTGTNGTQSITPYTFTNVTVPVVTSNDEVTFDAVATNTAVTVPVVTSNASVTATNTTTKSTTAATSATNATTVATGKVATTDTNGDSVLIGLGTAVTGSAVTGVGTATAAAQTITVGTNDNVNAVTDVTVHIVNAKDIE